MELRMTDAARRYATRHGGVVADHIAVSGCGKQPEVSVDIPRSGRRLDRYHAVVDGELTWYLSPTLPTQLTGLEIDISGWGPLRRLAVVGGPPPTTSASCPSP